MLPFLLLSLLLSLAEWLRLEGWRERIGQATVFAYFVFLALIFVLTALRFAQRHGWWGLLLWKTFYFACAVVFIGLAWTIIAYTEGYQLRWVHLVFWMLLGQAAAWFGIMMHLLVEEP